MTGALANSEIEAWSAIDGEDGLLGQACRYLLGHCGKRLRGTLVLKSAEYGVQPDSDEIRRAAVTVELVHTATLAHDDVLDRAGRRAGRSTTGAEYGGLASVFAGTWVFARAAELIARCGPGPISAWADMLGAICRGQMLEIEDLYDPDRTPERYLAASEGKTAVLFALAASLGAELSGASPAIGSALSRYGRELGLAFQISDDILDLVGDEQVTGKEAGKDLREGVYTLPVIYAARADAALRNRLLERFDAEEIPDLVAAVHASGGIEKAAADCRSRCERALAALEGLDRNEWLVELADATRDGCRGLTTSPGEVL